ncbi:VCBS repeat-containing protein [Ulvibacterium sp.]|uniref:VCBS repeat-containing protein n=1 Tax=Ulvibacterium sp. TaxID=2665914 RepID=UPI003BAAF2BC
MRNVLQSFLVVCCMLALSSCRKSDARFRLLESSHTGIDFDNKIKENDSINVFEFMNVYTGAGVAVGDINNDGLVDVYFSGNAVSGRLYLNKGDFRFTDITEEAGVLNNRWGTGATMVDINQDGWLDIYICVSGSAKESERANLLYINNGPSKDSGQLTFTERAAEYGLADTRQSMHAAFFDYDKDQDLDMYLLVNPAAFEHQVNSSHPRKLNGESVSNDRLYRNEGNGKFIDVSGESGILVEGYGLGVGISDINNDSWPDIYVSNDFIGNDILYINQGDGTFKDEITDYLNHTSYAGMGNDIGDINNDGKQDIFVLDMRPEDNKRRKLIISSLGYDRFQSMLEAGYDPQYTRNTLQLNRGEGKFSEIGFLAGVSSTDWSWSALLADYDNDGHKDLYITNGFLRDLGNLDYIHYQNIYNNPIGDTETKIGQKMESMHALPSANLRNYIYRNSGGIQFENVTESWGIKELSCSNGATYADLDNDGDLDLLVNNINQPAFVYENQSTKESLNHYLKIKLKGKPGNLQGIGAKVKVTTDSVHQHYEHFLSRGYESSIDPTIHFGLGKYEKVDAVEVWWPNGSYQVITDVSADQVLNIDQNEATSKELDKDLNPTQKMFVDITDSLKVEFRHREDAMVDFKLQPILPHMHSKNGPGIAIADINGDGLEDFYVGGASGQGGRLFLQDKEGSFISRDWTLDSEYEDMGALFFDANGDGFSDLYVVSGGVYASKDTEIYQDRLYLNDGLGNFTKSDALPGISASGSVVTASDFDKDGDLDLFVGGRIKPGEYPMPAQSYLLENITDENSGKVKFRDVGSSVPGWEGLTMVTGALWTDFDNDGWQDLIVVGEFMPIQIFHNNKGQWVHANEKTGLKYTEGWWNSISGGDFDGDGDTDYLLGNLGLNNKYQATDEEPLCIYASDYDKDGRIDPVMCYFVDGENHVAHTRDEIITQINAMRARFKTYESYAESTFETSFLPEELETAYVVKSHTFASSYLENKGGGQFELRPLPWECQIAPIEGIVVEDIDGDGNEDVLLTGNSYATEVASGRYDALKGMVLMGNGDGTFQQIPLEKSGFVNDHDGSGLGLLRNAEGLAYIVSANNGGPVRVFGTNNAKENHSIYWADRNSESAEIFFKDGGRIKKEFNYGSGYLSQQTRSIRLHDAIKEIKVKDVYGETKKIHIDEAVDQ